MKTDLYQACGHYWVFQICWCFECNTLTASSFRIWNSSTGIPSPTTLFVVVLPKAHMTSHFRMLYFHIFVWFGLGFSVSGFFSRFPWFDVLACFHGVNTSIPADFKLQHSPNQFAKFLKRWQLSVQHPGSKWVITPLWISRSYSSVLAWRIPGKGDPGGLPSMGLHRVRHDWSDLAATAGCS